MLLTKIIVKTNDKPCRLPERLDRPGLDLSSCHVSSGRGADRRSPLSSEAGASSAYGIYSTDDTTHTPTHKKKHLTVVSEKHQKKERGRMRKSTKSELKNGTTSSSSHSHTLHLVSGLLVILAQQLGMIFQRA